MEREVIIKRNAEIEKQLEETIGKSFFDSFGITGEVLWAYIQLSLKYQGFKVIKDANSPFPFGDKK